MIDNNMNEKICEVSEKIQKSVHNFVNQATSITDDAACGSNNIMKFVVIYF